MVKNLWAQWRRFGQWTGDHAARLLLVVFYFTIALPFGLLVRLTQDPLDRKGTPRWLVRAASSRQLDDARRSY